MKKKENKKSTKPCKNYQQKNFDCECLFCITKKVERCENSTFDCLCYCGSCDH